MSHVQGSTHEDYPMCRWSHSAFIRLPIRATHLLLALALHDTFSVVVQPRERCCRDLDPFSTWITFSFPCIGLNLPPFFLQSLRAAPLRLITCFFIFKLWLLVKFALMFFSMEIDITHSWTSLLGVFQSWENILGALLSYVSVILMANLERLLVWPSKK